LQKKLAFAVLLQFSSTFIPLMKTGSFTHKIFAIVLLLVFAQKMGGGLYLHNWLHVKNCEQSIPKTAGKNITSYSCNCIDDFSMPFTENDEKIVGVISALNIEYSSSFKSLIPLSSSFFFSLRAPPSLS